MLLSAHIEAASQAAWRIRHFRFRRAALQRHRGHDEGRVVFERAVDIGPVGQIAIFDPGEACGAAGLFARFADDDEDRLAVEFHFVDGQQGLVAAAVGGHIVDAGNILRRQNRHHAGAARLRRDRR